MIQKLPSPDVSTLDLKSLTLAFITNMQDDAPDGDSAARAKVKLDALRLMLDIIRADNTNDYESDVIAILNNDDKTINLVPEDDE